MEIERKWKLNKLPRDWGMPRVHILQGYVVAESNEIRLRKKGDRFFMTAKSDGTLAREEWETEIPKWVFEILWSKTEGKRIEKYRYSRVAPDGLMWEFDEYTGPLKGLVVLEIEFPNEVLANNFVLLKGIQGEDVTSDKRYKNKNLALNGLPK